MEALLTASIFAIAVFTVVLIGIASWRGKSESAATLIPVSIGCMAACLSDIVLAFVDGASLPDLLVGIVWTVSNGCGMVCLLLFLYYWYRFI